MPFLLGYMTAPTPQEAKQLVLALLNEKLIACATVLEGGQSHFFWEGKIQEAQETVVFFKTQSDHQAKIVERVKALHSYECPCVIFVEMKGGNPDFLSWITQTCP